MTVVLSYRGAEVASWPLPLPDRPGLGDVAGLARLQLGAGRVGCSIQLTGTPAALSALLDLLGLAEALSRGMTGAALRRQAVRQAEIAKQQVGLQEAVQPGDPVP